MFKELKGFGGNLFETEFAKNVKQKYFSHILVKLTGFDWYSCLQIYAGGKLKN